MTDFDQAIRLKPDTAYAYYNRGLTKAALGHGEEAQLNLTSARHLARAAGNDSLVALAEQTLQDLANRGAETPSLEPAVGASGHRGEGRPDS